MWAKISDISKINLGDEIMKYISDSVNNIENLNDFEKNSEIYRVLSNEEDELKLQLLVNGKIANMNVISMTKYVSKNELTNGNWWLKTKVK